MWRKISGISIEEIFYYSISTSSDQSNHHTAIHSSKITEGEKSVIPQPSRRREPSAVWMVKMNGDDHLLVYSPVQICELGRTGDAHLGDCYHSYSAIVLGSLL